MSPDLWSLYTHMLKSRLFEEAVSRLWADGYISGEMHLGAGEEGIVAGVVDHLRQGDAMALDHRGTSALLMRGVSPVRLLKEFLGAKDGLCHGQGGHMHLFDPATLAASSGIVGASGPAAVGFALSGVQLRPGSVSVAFFGEGAMNQGMMMEALNLAAVWKLPVLFVCKDNNWSITTRSARVTAGSVAQRARSMDMQTVQANGLDVEAVWRRSAKAIKRCRAGKGPVFLLAPCVHLEGHFLGDPLLRMARSPFKEIRKTTAPLLKAAGQRKGSGVWQRTAGLATVGGLIGKRMRQEVIRPKDPLKSIRRKLKDATRLKKVEAHLADEVEEILAEALKDLPI